MNAPIDITTAPDSFLQQQYFQISVQIDSLTNAKLLIFQELARREEEKRKAERLAEDKTWEERRGKEVQLPKLKKLPLPGQEPQYTLNATSSVSE